MHQKQHQKPLMTISYIPTKPEKEWYKHDLMTYLDDLKYKQFTEDMDSHFSRAKITQCRDDPLQNSQYYQETIFNSGFKNYEDRSHNQTISSVVKTELDDIHFKCDLLKIHIKSDIEKKLISMSLLIKKSRKNHTTDDCKSSRIWLWFMRQSLIFVCMF